MTNFTDKSFFAAIANADVDTLAAIFGDNAPAAIEKATSKLNTLNNRKPSIRKPDDSKRLANLATFNSDIAPFIESVQCATVADIRAAVSPDLTASKIGAILKVAVAEGLIERHEVKSADNFTVKCGTYYTVNGFEFERKAA